MYRCQLTLLALGSCLTALLLGCGGYSTPVDAPSSPSPVEAEQCTLDPAPNTLYSLAQCCKRDLNSNSSCRYYDPGSRYVVVKDHSDSKPQGYLTIPTDKVTGIEDPQVFTNIDVIDIWENSSFASYDFPAMPAPHMGLAINSKFARTENQLHIHMSCVRSDVDGMLQANDSRFGLYPQSSMFVTLNLPPRYYPYEIIKISQLGGNVNPWQAVLHIPHVDRSNMADQSIAIVGSQRSDQFYFLNTYYTGSHGTGDAEEILDQSCSAADLPLQFVPITPCRLIDTRGTQSGPDGKQPEPYPVAGQASCNIPPYAVAYSFNVTLVPSHPVGYLTLYPDSPILPNVSLMNSADGRVKANAAIITAGANTGSVYAYASNPTNLILDIDGYFESPTPTHPTLAFYPLRPCRIADTRGGQYLHAGQVQNFPISGGTCGIPSTAQGYSLNFTALPRKGTLSYLSAWPAGKPQPNTSILNAPTGTVVANAALLPAGTSGNIATYASNDTDLLIDTNGYFAPSGPGGLSLRNVKPCRVLDTRSNGGHPFTGRLSPPVRVAGNCGVPSTALAVVFNATVLPAAGPVGYLTLWPDGQPQPTVSTLNAYDGALTSNMAMVPLTNGSVDAYADGTTHLLLDISGYFAP